MKKFIAIAAVCALFSVLPAVAADYPRRAVTINTSKSGSMVDYVARAFAKSANKHFGANLVVNSTSGQIAAVRETIKANPDGYTIGIVNNTVIINDVLGSARFDSINDVALIATLGDNVSSWVAIRKDLADKGVKTLKDLFDYCEKHPDDLIISDRTASNTNTAVLQLMNAGLKVTPADVGTSTDRLTNFLSGNCDIFLGSYGLISQYIQRGDVICLASCSTERSRFSPDVPCTYELGYQITCPATYYVFAPRDIPSEVKTALDNLCAEAVADPDFIKDLANNAIENKYRNTKETYKNLGGMKQNMLDLGMDKKR